MIDGALVRTVLRELFSREQFPRQPEQDVVMSDGGAVAAYVKAGRADGALAGAYLFHADQIGEVVRPGETALDLGCGPASLLGLVAELLPESRFVGVDLSEEMLGYGRAAARERNVKNLELRVDDMTTLATIADRSIDAVVSSMALHHLPDGALLERCFAAMARVLKPGGGVYLTDFGRLKSLRSVDYFVQRAAPGEDPLLARDYDQSLRAAFTVEELATYARRHLGTAVRVYATRPSPLIVAVKSAVRNVDGPAKARLRERARSLPPPRREDLRQMQAFLRLGGLRSTL